MKKVLLQLMPSGVDLAEAAEIPGGRLPITKKLLEMCLAGARRDKKTVMHPNR